MLNKLRAGDLTATPPLVDTLLESIDCLRSMVNDIDNSHAVDIARHCQRLERAMEGAESCAAPAEASLPIDAPVPVAEVPGPAVAEPPIANKPTGSAAETTVRVPVAILDRLMNLTGELVLGRNQLLQTIETQGHVALKGTGDYINRITSELQEAVMRSRMQPLDNVFGKFQRVVRDLGQRLGKKCDLTIEGREVELDKSIIEAIADPLTHLVRNALDHGVESPDVRAARGKRPTGTIRLAAVHQAGRVLITISDDGAGIDAEKLKAKAISKGLLTAEQAAQLGRREALDLVFHPGLSTAQTVTEISGRGVGMDVVRTNIAKLGGAIEIDTELGAGSTIRIKLPLTLAIMPALIVSGGGRRFAIAQSSIQELVRVRSDERAGRVEIIKDAEVLRLRGKLLPLVRVSTLLGPTWSAAANETAPLEIVVVESDKHRFGLVVDGLHDSEEIVVKPLGRHLKSSNCLLGATVLGDGQIALILDVANTAARANLAEINTQDAEPAKNEFDAESQSMLLFANHADERFAAPLSIVKRIERVEASQVVELGGQRLLQYRASTLPLLALEDHVKALPRTETARCYVLVYSMAGFDVGLLASQINDIRHLPPELDAVTCREPGILGSVVIEGQTIRVVDLYQLAGIAHPDWLRTEAPPVGPSAPKRLLLAEDSGFFRNQVASFLESQGYEVVKCEDGQHAWETLCSGEHEIHGIVTDIEMPRLNGLEFCSKVKSSEAYQRLPVIALTSLAGSEDVRRGEEAGIDEYQVKMDREQLLAAVRRLLKTTTYGSRERAVNLN